MHVTVRLFAMLRERAGASAVELELPETATVADALSAVAELTAGLPVVMAVNRHYADRDCPLAAGDELALIPPVSGGAGDDDAVHVALREDPLSADELLARVRDDRAGAVVSFHGVTREVDRLDYEAYREMASESLRDIALAAHSTHGLCRVAVAHRTGPVPRGEASVMVVVSAAHRAQAFAGARAIIDAIKEQTPIWKREVQGTRLTWVAGRAPQQ